MNNLLLKMKEALAAGQKAILCTITASHGSTPRGVGAKMLVLEDGSTAGTIGGGTAEYQAALYAQTLLAEGRSETKTYDMGGASDPGMICGGTVEVLFQYIAPGGAQAREALEDLEKETEDRVLLFGAGHVGQALVPVLTQANFSVVVWDDRDGIPAPSGARAMYGGPCKRALERLGPVTAEDYVVVMTHGHQADYEILAQALGTPAKYIGCIGSRRKAAAIRERLLAAGFAPEEVARIWSPIGLPIGGEAPGEIAVSVAAQLIACRSGRLGKDI